MFNASIARPSVSASLQKGTRGFSRLSCPDLSALQVLPYRLTTEGEDHQFFGPDIHTAGWVVLEHWSDGSRIEHAHYSDEAQAIEIAQTIAAASGAYVEPYPWVIAVCVADGWEIVPCDDGSGRTGEAWGFQRTSNSAYPNQALQSNVFDAWRACLAYASKHACN